MRRIWTKRPSGPARLPARMKLVLLVALSLCAVGVTVAASPTASACTPPNCPGFGDCHVTWEWISDDVRVPTGVECYY